MKLPKLIITDIDGVWTDAGMYYDQRGNELKKFNTADSFGVILCREFDIPVAIITGERTEIVARRAGKLNIKYLYQGSSDKIKDATDLLSKLDVDWQDVAHIGDDLGDYHLLKKVGISGAPSNAADFIKEVASIHTVKAGGDGAFREFVETIFKNAGLYEEALERLLK